MPSARLIIDDEPFPDGVQNMARDEALLAACNAPDVSPVVRFYGWSHPTISLGYFQEFSKYEALEPPARELAIVRRTTGGGAILHDLEVTYSIVIPAAHPILAGQSKRLYRLAHEAIIQTIGHGTRMLGAVNEACGESSQRGPFFCFERRHDLDVIVDDPKGPAGVSKIAGSAQRRTPTAILQHGSIMLDSRFSQQLVRTWKELAEAVSFQQAVSKLAPSFEAALGLSLAASEWSADELASARSFESRYAGDDWTIRRQR